MRVPSIRRPFRRTPRPRRKRWRPVPRSRCRPTVRSTRPHTPIRTAGETVLYLEDGTEVHLDTSTSTAKYWAQRYYTAAGQTIALRTNKSGTGTLSWLAADQHGTSSLVLDATSQAVTKRYTTPFGASRAGGTGTWPDDKAFLGKSADSSTGLTYVGARQYDPTIGRFLSVDPLLDTSDSQSLNGYTYADNSPVTQSDPTGLESCGPVHFCSGSNGTYGTYHAENDPGSKKYQGSSHYCDTHKCSSGTATTSNTGQTKKKSSGWGWLSDVKNTVVDYGTAIFSQPDVWIGGAETVGSMFLMGFGGDAVIGGAAVCLTGVGCLAGAPAVAGGVGLIGVGAVGTADGIGRINDGLGKAFREAKTNSSSGSDNYDDVTINDAHITNGHTPEGIFASDASKTEWLPETTPESRAALIKDVLRRGKVNEGTDNKDGVVKEFTYEEPVGHMRNSKRTPLYTLRVYYDPDLKYVRNAFPVK
ncbi:RHS repeat-associated core domain-containing protein [Streptomyces sp. SID13726]|nr:RHS repeat-associated core domain-containing protein [Streptomyces sp. SID13726]